MGTANYLPVSFKLEKSELIFRRTGMAKAVVRDTLLPMY